VALLSQLLLVVLIVKKTLSNLHSAVLDVRENPDIGWTLLEVSTAQRGSSFLANYLLGPTAYPGSRTNCTFVGIYGTNKLFLHGL